MEVHVVNNVVGEQVALVLNQMLVLVAGTVLVVWSSIVPPVVLSCSNPPNHCPAHDSEVAKGCANKVRWF
jgi:hypothetical protein